MGDIMAARSTLAAPASHLVEVKHSRFLAQALAVDSPEAAMAALPGLCDPAATHNCWAWRVGAHYRSSDDGEPAGTAGRPILAAIDGQACDQTLVVVTRWFGGIKLGAGGLVRAYGGAAAECLRRGARRPLIAYAEFAAQAPFADLGTIHAVLGAFEAQKLHEDYDAAGVVLHIRLPADRVDDLKTRLRDATRDRIRFSTA